IAVCRKRSTCSAPEALSISYFTGAPPCGISTITLISSGGLRPMAICSMFIVETPWGRASARLALAILQHLHLLDGDEAAAHHAVEQRQEGVDSLLPVDDLDHHRQILAEPEHLGGMQPARMAEAHRPAQNRGAGQVLLARLQHDRLVERQMLMMVILADEDAQQHGVAGNLHSYPPEKNAPRAKPAQTARRHSRTEATMLPKTRAHCASRARLSVCRLKDEKVV